MKLLRYFVVTTILFIILSPIVFMILFSFSDNTFITFPIHQYSPKWYVGILSNQALMNSLLLTILVGVVVSSLSVFLGFMSGYWLSNSKSTHKPLVLAIFTIPAIIPFILYALGFLEFTRYVGFARTTFAVIIAHTVVFSPLATVYFYHQIGKLNKDIEHTARELGSPEYRIIFEIVGGQIMKNVFVCFALIFALSWDEYIISWFVSGFQKTYAVQIKNMLESSFTPGPFAIGSIMAFFSLILISAVYKLSKKELTQ